jgi:hypothetical protein
MAEQEISYQNDSIVSWQDDIAVYRRQLIALDELLSTHGLSDDDIQDLKRDRANLCYDIDNLLSEIEECKKQIRAYKDLLGLEVEPEHVGTHMSRLEAVNAELKTPGLSDKERKTLKKKQARLCLKISEEEVAAGNYADVSEFMSDVIRSVVNPVV